MSNLKFDKKTGNLLPQKIKYHVKHEEETEEMIEMLDEYIKKKTDFQIDYDERGNARFTEKEEKLEIKGKQ